MKMKKMFGVLVGVIIVAAGVVLALKGLGLVTPELSFDGWWTVFIIAPCLVGLIESRDKLGNLLGLSVGVLLLLAARGVFAYSAAWKLIVAAAVLLCGVKLIIKSLRGEGADASAVKKEEAGKVESMAVFSENEPDYSDVDVKSAKVGAVFGGTKCNLTNARLCKNAQLDVFCLFGGAEIIVPENTEVKINTFSLFGGVSDKRAVTKSEEPDVVLTVNGCCIFGGVDITLSQMSPRL